MLDIVLMVEAADRVAALFDDPRFRKKIASICETRQLAAFALLLERAGNIESAEHLVTSDRRAHAGSNSVIANVRHRL
ncbi:hypothetical protein ACFVUS_29890 [Nocardia sp. NPDC058058]|uniref:hypothetical protein n=1 Tax=Nocardia sp. NPDC058058 TaxID=3346317 RepID=UPI0036DCF727